MGASQAQASQPTASGGRCLLTTSVTATTVSAALEELNEARQVGADVAELRLDFLSGFDADRDLAALLAGSPLPVIVTFRPTWEGGSYGGPEEPRLAALWRAVQQGAAYVDVELKAASQFFASTPQGVQRSATGTKIILSSHNYVETPSLEELRSIHRLAVKAGADIVKVAAMCQCITDVHRLVALLAEERTRPTIALGMGEAGQVRGHCALPFSSTCDTSHLTASQVSRILAPKFGCFLTFGALRAGKESAPGQTTMQQLVHTFRLRKQVR